MSYRSGHDPYIDPTTGILRNLLGITDEETLEKAEADITAAAIASLDTELAAGEFNLTHLKDIHWSVFHTIYDWAGELRTVEVEKGRTRFANSEVLEEAANDILVRLHADKLLTGLHKEEYVVTLAHYYSEVNVLHPFREGNGRAQRVFFDLLARQSGYRLAWERMDAQENIRACIAAYSGDEAPLAKMLDSLLGPLYPFRANGG